MPDSFQSDVFLSHNAKDKPRVRRRAGRRRAAGLRVWFDEWEFPVAASRQSAAFSPGSRRTHRKKDGGALPRRRYDRAIERGLETSRTLVLCLSPAALGSDWVGLERSTVLFRDPSNAGRWFLFWRREAPSPQHQQHGRTSSAFDLARQDSQPLVLKKNEPAKSGIDASLRGLQVGLKRAVTFSDNSDQATKGPPCLA